MLSRRRITGLAVAVIGCTAVAITSSLLNGSASERESRPASLLPLAATTQASYIVSPTYELVSTTGGTVRATALPVPSGGAIKQTPLPTAIDGPSELAVVENPSNAMASTGASGTPDAVTDSVADGAVSVAGRPGAPSNDAASPQAASNRTASNPSTAGRATTGPTTKNNTVSGETSPGRQTATGSGTSTKAPATTRPPAVTTTTGSTITVPLPQKPTTAPATTNPPAPAPAAPSTTRPAAAPTADSGDQNSDQAGSSDDWMSFTPGDPSLPDTLPSWNDVSDDQAPPAVGPFVPSI